MSATHLIGHERQREWFRRAIARGRLSHAYLFTGPPGIGKRRFADHLSQTLFCERVAPEELAPCGVCGACRQFLADTHPDFHTIEIPKWKRIIPLEKFLGPEERRGREGLLHDLSLRPMSSDRRIAIIDDSQAMSEEAANSLLKTLEEPSPKSLIVLITDQPDSLLPTIRSRCQLVRFQPLGDSQVADILLAEELVANRAEAESLASAADGSLAIALMQRDGIQHRFTQLAAREFLQNSPNPVEIAKQVLELLDELGTADQREQFGWMLRSLAELYRQCLRGVADPSRVTVERAEFIAGMARSPEELTDLFTQVLDRILEAERQLAESMAVPTCVEGLSEDVARCHRRAGAISR